MRPWVLLHYRLPSTPSASRVSIWRKLKQLGALLLHDSIWVLPDTPWTAEQFQWLASEIDELQGEAMLWQAHITLPGQEEKLIQRFLAASQAEYQPISEALQHDQSDRAALSNQFQRVRRRDYFGAPLGQQIYDTLTRTEET